MGELAALLMALLWALTSTMVGSQSGRVPAAVINAVQLAAASLVLWGLTAVLLATGAVEVTTPWRAVALAATALIGPGAGDMLYYGGIRFLGVGRAFPIAMASSPLFTIALAALVAGEAITAPVLAGALLTIAGILLIAVRSRSPSPAERRPAPRAGVLIVLAAAALWGVSAVTLRVVAKGVDVPVASSIRMPAAAAFAFILARSTGKTAWPLHYGARSVVTLAVAGIVGAGLGSMLYLFALDQAGAARTSILSSTSPLFALPLAALLLHERITRRMAAGTVLAVAGICLVSL